MKTLVVLVLILFVALFLYVETDLPRYGDRTAPAHTHLSPLYIEQSMEHMNTPNVVTAVLADYRGYDTLGETVVIFTATLAITLILPVHRWRRRSKS